MFEEIPQRGSAAIWEVHHSVIFMSPVIAHTAQTTMTTSRRT
jgi:hypothetical protein